MEMQQDVAGLMMVDGVRPSCSSYYSRLLRVRTMDSGMDAGPSSRKESLTGNAVMDDAKDYEAENVRESREQSAESCAPDDFVTGDEAVNSAGRSQLDDLPQLNAADEGTKGQSRTSLSGNSDGPLQNVVEARGIDGESVSQSTGSGELDSENSDGTAARENQAGAGTGAGPSSGSTGDSVIDIDGSHSSPSASAPIPGYPAQQQRQD